MKTKNKMSRKTKKKAKVYVKKQPNKMINTEITITVSQFNKISQIAKENNYKRSKVFRAILYMYGIK